MLSHSANGIEIQTYCAIIACMLISLWTGRKPTLRTYEMICLPLKIKGADGAPCRALLRPLAEERPGAAGAVALTTCPKPRIVSSLPPR